MSSSAQSLETEDNVGAREKSVPDLSRQAWRVLALLSCGLLTALVLGLMGTLLWLRPAGTAARFFNSLFGQPLQGSTLLILAGIVVAAALLMLLLWRWRVKRTALCRAPRAAPSAKNMT